MSEQVSVQSWRRLAELVQRRVVEPNALSAEARLLLVLLVRMAGEGGESPSQRAIAGRLGFSEAIVANRLCELEEYGFLARTAEGGPKPDVLHLEIEAIRGWAVVRQRPENRGASTSKTGALVPQNRGAISRARVNASSSSSQSSLSEDDIERLSTMLRQHGLAFRNPLKPSLVAWMAEGITEEDLAEFALKAAENGARAWVWMEACFRTRLRERLGTAGGADIIDLASWRGGAA